MFDLIPNLISYAPPSPAPSFLFSNPQNQLSPQCRAVVSTLLPLYFTYKSLRAPTPQLLIPWLQYWSTLSLFLLVESYTPLISWLPLYGTLRLGFLLYLVLPQTQGARYLYASYIEPFFVDNEHRIDRLIADTHRKLRDNGLDYAWQAVEWVKANVLHVPSQAEQQRQPRPQPRSAESYVSGLMARFSTPAPAPSAAANTSPAGDLYTLLSTAASTLGINPSMTPSAAARDAQIDSLAHSGALVPPHLKSVSERVEFVGAQREKLLVLLGALDREAGELEMQKDVERRMEQGPGGLTKSRSEGDFERVERDEAGNGNAEEPREAPGVGGHQRGGSGSGGWFGWLGGGSGKDHQEEREERVEGRSSGIEH
ncbi:MAG: hypothetical protein LQ340_003738 [Diploschistes diacapsis]|nr:MAG: hypothetical protein LQ340_003738 [Diploschistes diacapsis]